MRIDALGATPGAIATQLPADLTALTRDDTEQLAEAYADYGLIVLRGRELAVEEQLAVCGALGTVIDQAATGIPWFNITNRNGGYDGQLCFHADFSNTAGLLTGASLYAAVLPAGPTSTLFAHTGWALAELAPELRDRIRDRNAVHSAMTPGTIADTPVRRQADRAADPRAEHPLELVHPETGRAMLFVSDMQTEYITGMERGASDDLLDELTGWIQNERFVYRHQWQLHDLVVWDQIVMQHSRAAESVSGERTLRRVSFTHRSYADACQSFFLSLGGRAGRSGTQTQVM